MDQGCSVNQFAVAVSKALGFADCDHYCPSSPCHRRLPHDQYYCVSLCYGTASDGSTGWVVRVLLRSGTRNFVLAETVGSLARSGSTPTNAALRVCPYRRALRHAAILGLR